jgi:hypothetical protein
MTEADMLAPTSPPGTPRAEHPAGEDHELYVGVCRGGPWHGRHGESRYPQGFLLIDKPRRRVWLYDRMPDGSFRVRSQSPAPLLDDGPDNRRRAAEQPHYDIRVPDGA